MLRRRTLAVISVAFLMIALTGCQPKRTGIPPEGTKATEYWIDEHLRYYEERLVEAINTGRFEVVADLLVRDSSLYVAQQQLVADLYKRKVQEKLVTWDVVDKKRTEEDTWLLYVTETIGIKYPDKPEFVNKEFRWIYTLKVRNGFDPIGLSDIARWEDK